MSVYKTLTRIGTKLLKPSTFFKYAFNLSPMYRRSTGRVIEVSESLLQVKIKIPISYKNRNYVNSIFGGSMFSATDPIAMIQLIYILGEDYVVWDKSSEIRFRKPAKQDLYAQFEFTAKDIENIKKRIDLENEINFPITVLLTDESKSQVFCKINKVIYIADKTHYKAKRKAKTESQ
ncbi:DUF4442 domain-containing protein [Reichenbachiella versicolor]|uniref:DUF4442 domain-containing protein n=1 Tax=Reichenbachiella versicolor TaxID=1821036 RepID=UPI000D6E3244|nr:DUF4442 domain-containing protein [Reichenbachiella versicolor]